MKFQGKNVVKVFSILPNNRIAFKNHIPTRDKGEEDGDHGFKSVSKETEVDQFGLALGSNWTIPIF